MDHEIDKLAWLLIKDNKVMMARSKGKDVFYLPGEKEKQGKMITRRLSAKSKKKCPLIL